jgi:Cu-Zn family superoxide dismutase
LLLAGAAAAQQPETARAVLRDSTGRQVGSVTLTQTPHGVLLRAELVGVPPGVHALHVHAVGKCEGPSFQSAGGHFNPHRRQHGLLSPEGPHAGDAPNVHVGAGIVTFEVLFSQVTLSRGDNALLDADGAAVVVHAGADDYATDPAGNAGARIACGVVEQ